MSACRSCGAPIVWALTQAHRRRMPVDAEPTDDGNVILSDDDPPIAVVLPAGQAALFAVGTGAYRYTSHYATCPQADQWRTTR